MAEMTFGEMETKLAYIGNAARSVCRLATNKGAKRLSERQKAAAYVSERPRKVDGRIVAPGGMRDSIGWRPLKTGKEISGGKAGLDVGKLKKDEEFRSGQGHLYVLGTDHRYHGVVRARGYPNSKHEVKLTRPKLKLHYTGKARPHLPSFIKMASQAAEAEVMQVVADAIVTGIEKEITKQGG